MKPTNTLIRIVTTAPILAASVNAQPDYRTVILQRGAIPGLSGSIGSLTVPTIDADGGVQSLASTPNVVGVFAERPSSGFRVLARSGDAAPGYAPPAFFQNFAGLNEAQDGYGFNSTSNASVCVVTSVFDGSEFRFAVHAGSASPLAAQFRQGDAVNGLPGRTIEGFREVLAQESRTLIVADLDDFNAAIILRDSAGSRLIAVTGGQAPALPAGVRINSFEGAVRMNPSGAVLFAARLEGPGITFANNSAIFIHSGGVTSVLARTGDPAPGSPAGSVYTSLDRVSTLDALGRVAFVGVYLVPGELQNTVALFQADGGSPAPVFVQGGQVPGLPVGARWDGFDAPSLNSTGGLAFRAGVTGSPDNADNTTGLFRFRGTLERIVKRTDVLPGLGTTSGVFSDPSINALGQVLFLVGDTSVEGAFLSDQRGPLVPVVYFGQQLPIGSGVTRTVQSMSLAVYGVDDAPVEGPATNLEDGRPAAMNNRGQVAFRAFTDDPTFFFSQGIFVFRGDAPPSCPADFNGDGFLDFFDYNDYVACFEGSGAPGCDADFNGDGFIDFFDYNDFVAAFEAGC
jgi:hypothetical protein